MQVLTDFSEREKNYLLYEQRLEAERVELTWHEQLHQAMADLERERREKEREHQEKERERREKEWLLQEMERLQTLLQQSGIDPSGVE